MTSPRMSTDIELLLSRINSIFSSTKHLEAAGPIGKRQPRSSALSATAALGVVLVAVALSASLLAPGRLVAAFTETIGTFQSDCSTPKTSFNLGDPVCAAVTGASGQRRIVWVAPSGDVAQISAFF